MINKLDLSSMFALSSKVPVFALSKRIQNGLILQFSFALRFYSSSDLSREVEFYVCTSQTVLEPREIGDTK
jgi:hypothetical protein